MALGADVTVSVVFGIFMAIISLLALWQVAHYAARGLRSEYMPLSLHVDNQCVGQNPQSETFELEA